MPCFDLEITDAIESFYREACAASGVSGFDILVNNAGVTLRARSTRYRWRTGAASCAST